MDEWVDIKGYEGLYMVNNTGSVRSIRNDIFLKSQRDKDGYCIATLCFNGERKHHKVHRLVAEAFIPNPNNYPVINHKDEDKLNNNFKNLEWCTVAYNNNYGTRLQRGIQKITGKKKANVYGSKVVCEKYIFNTIKECAETYGIKPKTMSYWLNNPISIPDEFIDLGLKFYKTDNDETYVEYGKTSKTTIVNYILHSSRLGKYTGKDNKNYGSHMSEESKNKLRSKATGRNGIQRGKSSKSKKVYCDGKLFDCVKDCSDYHNVNYSTMCKWLSGTNKMPPDFKYMNLHYSK